MANNVQYTIGFKADNSQAKKALQELSSAFEKLEKKQISLNYNDLDLNTCPSKQSRMHQNFVH